MRSLNLSTLDDQSTARTDPEAALQRAENLAVLGARSVLELCCGPSLRVLEAAYARHGITCVGNDIQRRWREYYPQGQWTMGDAMLIEWQHSLHGPGDIRQFDAVVFAPPVTIGCTGKREDALEINDVYPRYSDFLARPFSGIKVMVLPARALATRYDRKQMYGLIGDRTVEVVPLTSGRRRIRKYVDVYLVEDDLPPGQATQVGEGYRP